MRLSVLTLVAFIGCTGSHPRMTEAQVLAVAEPALRARFPETFDATRPYHARCTNGVWWVHGTLPKDTQGGTPEAEVRDSDGKILTVYHTQ